MPLDSNATFALDHENSCFAARMSHVLAPDCSKEYVASFEGDHCLDATLSIVHVYNAVEDREDFFAVINVPFVWLVRPMKSGRDATHAGYGLCAPSSISLEIAAADYVHNSSPTTIAIDTGLSVPDILLSAMECRPKRTAVPALTPNQADL
jgi:hypothetical protein